MGDIQDNRRLLTGYERPPPKLGGKGTGRKKNRYCHRWLCGLHTIIFIFRLKTQETSGIAENLQLLPARQLRTVQGSAINV